jgi:hypothetical protein
MSLRERTRPGLGIIEPCLQQCLSLAMRKTLVFILILSLIVAALFVLVLVVPVLVLPYWR